MIYLLNMVIFRSYVELPEGKQRFFTKGVDSHQLMLGMPPVKSMALVSTCMVVYKPQATHICDLQNHGFIHCVIFSGLCFSIIETIDPPKLDGVNLVMNRSVGPLFADCSIMLAVNLCRFLGPFSIRLLVSLSSWKVSPWCPMIFFMQPCRLVKHPAIVWVQVFHFYNFLIFPINVYFAGRIHIFVDNVTIYRHSYRCFSH